MGHGEYANRMMDTTVLGPQDVVVKRGAVSGAYLHVPRCRWISRHYETVREACGARRELLAEQEVVNNETSV